MRLCQAKSHSQATKPEATTDEASGKPFVNLFLKCYQTLTLESSKSSDSRPI
ncbi:hypothetical protein [Coleofasciculus sp. FACHB-1120]|uniref:hypothetical protein n=1 Tax=Coleofasciculus sp. FACHB-1120 TaxID=2692783 RepID=UPI00168270ED|nr:hypothetical protein [Coleofasciculus sp. FACHB-1120]MBD2742472.1 hypothetical protein [Coleofasciculus sp. FACHB-1120]